MNEFVNIRCIVFDLDDTLWPCEPTIVKAEAALYDWLEEKYPQVTNQYSLEQLRQHHLDAAMQKPHIAHDVTVLRKQSLQELAQKFGYPSALAEDGLALFRKYRSQVTLFDDALPTISRLGKSFKIGVITNGNADLGAMGLDKHFEFIVTAAEVGVAKPNKGIFEFARKKANLETHELLYIGDHPEIDVLGAKKCGWKTLWFNSSKADWIGESRPDAQIHSLKELPSLLSI